MYKFIGIGLLPLLVLIVIPFSSGNQSDDLGMYGMLTVSHKDKSGNVLSETQIHNELVDDGTRTILERTFRNAGTFSTASAESVCVTDEVAFAVDEAETATSFNLGGTTGFPYTPCVGVNWTVNANSATSGVINFTADTAYQNGTTITGVGICASVNGAPFNNFDCETSSIGTSAFLLGVIDIVDVTPGEGDQIDVTYTVNLD